MKSAIPALLLVAAAVLPAAARSAQQPASAVIQAALDHLAQALRQRDMAPLLPVMDPGFRVGEFTGDMARSIIGQVVAAGRILPESISVDSITPAGEHFRIAATFKVPEGVRSHDLVVTREGRFVEINVMRVTSGSGMPTGGSGAALPPAPVEPANEALRAELLRMLADDQRHRRELADAPKAGAPADLTRTERLDAEQARMDRANVNRLVEILDAQGWPGPSKVGPEAAGAAFLVLQHAPIDVQEKYLPMARNAAAAGELPRSSLALLEDRVLMRRGKPQIYGTQLRTNPETKKMAVWTIEDEANVDRRRAAVGLEPLADYLLRFGVKYEGAR